MLDEAEAYDVELERLFGMLDLTSPPKAKPAGPWPYPLPPKPPPTSTLEEWRATFAPKTKDTEGRWLAALYFGICLLLCLGVAVWH